MSGTLYVVATPIGNLADLTPRARDTLASVAVVAAEDTRRTGRLLLQIGVKKPLLALHDHNEVAAAEKLVAALQNGDSIALVSDAGTPLISDPGYRLLVAATAAGITVSPIPGPSALTAALSVSGLPTDRFCFEGFLPAKSAARLATLESLLAERRTMVFFEGVHRIEESLADFVAVLGAARRAFIGRELTKLHEQCVTATLGELLAMARDGTLIGKGEFVIAVAGSSAALAPDTTTDKLLLELIACLPGRQAVDIVERVTGGKRNDIYQRMLALKQTSL